MKLKDATKIFIGGNPVAKIYRGEILVYSSEEDPVPDEEILVFRDTFPRSVSTSLNELGWFAYLGSTAVNSTTGTSANAESAVGDAAISVNAYNPDVSDTLGFARHGYSGHTFVNYITSKYTIDRSTRDVSKIRLRYGASNNTNHNVAPIIKIGSQWFRLDSRISYSGTVHTSDANFNTDSMLMEFVITPSMTNIWREVTLNPTVGYSEGSIVSSLPSGNITEFGINVLDNSTSGRTHRFDSVEFYTTPK
jgi:hypothetical protein